MYKLTSVSSKNIFGTMNTGTIRLSNLTDADRELIMHRHNLTTMDGLTDKDITREDIWNYLRDNKWRYGVDLTLADMVQDIIHTDNLEISKFVESKNSLV